MILHTKGHRWARSYIAEKGIITHRWCLDCERYIRWEKLTSTIEALDWKREEIQS